MHRHNYFDLLCIYSSYFLQIQCKQAFISTLNSYLVYDLTSSYDVDFVYFHMVFSSFDVSFYVSNIKNAISFWRFYLVFKMQLDRLRNEHYSTECAHSIFCSLSNCIIFFLVILIHYPFSNTFFSQLTK